MKTKMIGISWRLVLLFIVASVFFQYGEEVKETKTPAQREEQLKHTSGIERLRLLNQLIVDYMYGAPGKSLDYAREAVHLGEELDDPDEFFNALNRSGNWYYINRQYEDAVGYYLKALELEPRLDNKRLVANVLTNIGLVYWELGNYQSSEEYHARALELRKRMGCIPDDMAITLNGLGLALEGKGDYSKALEYYTKALEIHKQSGNKRRAAAALTNIANIQLEMKKYSTALHYFWQSISAYREAGFPWGEANSSIGAGSVYTIMGEYEKALAYLQSALDTAKKINDDDLIQDTLLAISELYEKQGRFKTALDYHEEYLRLKRKLLEKRNDQLVSVMKIKYETEKKERELHLLRKVNRGERIIYIFLGIAGLLAAALVIALHLRYITGKQINRRLQASEVKYRTLFDHAGDAIFLTDGPTLIDCNEKTLEAFGVTREEIIGCDFSEFSPPTQPDGRDSRETGMEIITKTLQGNPQQFYWVHRKKDLTPFHAVVSLSLFNIEGKPMIQAIVHDIGEQEQLEEHRVKTARLETAALLAGGIAYDFNTFLAVIMSNLEPARMNIPPDHAAAPFLSRLETTLLSAGELVGKFLTIAEGDSPPGEPLSIGGLTRDTLYSVLVESTAGVECRIEIPGDLWIVDGDKRQIKQLTRNLLQNAVDAVGAAGGGEMSVSADNVELRTDEIAALPAGPYIRVTVRDNGGGILPEHLPRIFDPYFTTRSEFSRKRLGMGLTAAQAVAKRHKGAVTASSNPDEGTTFRVYLPARREEEGKKEERKKNA